MAQRPIDVQSIFNTIFGCCLGRRQDESSDSVNNRSAGQNDERTPLLGEQSEGQRGTGYTGKDGQVKVGTESERIGTDGMLDVQLADKGKTDFKGIVKPKREVDLAKLKLIREHAQSAFFNVESSQLLPSTNSTLHQRAANMGASQRLTHNKRDAPIDDASYTAHQRKELIAASDKAERVYKAALKSILDKAINENVSINIEASEQSEVDERASIGLVRQIRLSVRDSIRNASLNEKDKNDDQTRQSSSTDTQQRFDRPKFSLQNSSDSLSNDEEFTQSQNQIITKMASVHSLRTLRLEPASQLSITPMDDTDGLFSRSAQSTATTNDTDKQLSQSTDDEAWERRGRTRSRRGLVWMDTTKAGNEAMTKKKTRLEEMWKDNKGGDSTQIISQAQSNNQQALPDEIQYGLRFEANKGIQRRKEILEKLKSVVQQPMAETWEENNSAEVS